MDMTNEEYKQLTKWTKKFRNLEYARSYADHCEKLHMIVMGDCDEDGGWYLVDVPRVTEKLVKNGYEYIR